MVSPLPIASIRTQVPLALRFADGYLADARVFSFNGLVDGQEHLAFGLGDHAAAVTSAEPDPLPLVRLHSQCLTGDVFGSQRCSFRDQTRSTAAARVPGSADSTAALIATISRSLTR